KEDLPRFDLVFRQFWGRTRQIIIPSDTGSLEAPAAPAARDAAINPDTPQPRPRPTLPLIERSSLIDSEDAEEGGPTTDEDVTRALLYSAQERLRNMDFAHFTDEELTAAKALLATWTWKPGLRRTRRLAPARRG